MADLGREQICKSICIYEYTVPLLVGVNIWGESCYERRGLLLKFANDKGEVAWGEVAPINFSRAAIDNCVQEILHLRDKISNPSLGDILTQVREPSLKFGVYGAMMQFEWSVGMEEERLLDESVKVNALLLGNDEGVFSRLERLYEKGVRTFKLKVDKFNWKTLVSRLEEMALRELSLIVDFNRGFGIKEALEMAEVLHDLGLVAYVEDPVESVKELFFFLDNSDIKVGVDEYLVSDWKTVELCLSDFGDKLIMIVKPSVLLGTDRWEKIVSNVRLKKVFTSSWEIGVGTRTVLMMSYRVNGGIVHTGVGTYSYIKDELCMPRLDVERCRIPLREVVGSISVDESMLKYLGKVDF